ncbi:uncharacterized protein PpBr36_09447 [Pyricularia pennisetigena]|uniref:uncharacterized protein n=1 Tax=Pyricularia pennisetigena TaxID=1578925 RepID=UPI0011530FD6|nr:uncharacterized protein PpBr36_09447 [Pyricularia pennisetigena]TLS21626.1 hypothetical protein PpBr36_09447 [Pyricularia pennisetigena]
MPTIKKFCPSDFVSFYEFDPASDRRCIYLTQKKFRCKLSCHQEDRDRACKLYIRFTTTDELPDLEQVQEYAKLNCCRGKRIWHQDRIEDQGNLVPLAERWLDEIRLRMGEKTVQHAARTASITTNNGIAQAQAASPSSATNPSSPAPPQSTPRYNLRSRQVAGSAGQSSGPAAPPKFAEYDTEPTDDVASAFRRPLGKRRDWECGWVYAFDRSSTPGHVKIGWTARSVVKRLESWAKCGCPPRLVHSTDAIPHAHRAEALVHCELARERRKERGCQSCGGTHIEWFEVSRERATQVIKNWATIFSTNPYDGDGKLKEVWVRVIGGVVKDGEAMNAEALLARYALLSARGASVLTPAQDVKAASPPRSAPAKTPAMPRQAHPAGCEPDISRGERGLDASVEAAALKCVLNQLSLELLKLIQAQIVLSPPLPRLEQVRPPSKVLETPILAT